MTSQLPMLHRPDRSPQATTSSSDSSGLATRARPVLLVRRAVPAPRVLPAPLVRRAAQEPQEGQDPPARPVPPGRTVSMRVTAGCTTAARPPAIRDPVTSG